MTARKPLQIFLAVEKALFLRELNMSISVGKAGLFWTFFEPFFQILLFVMLHAAMKGYSGGESSTSTYDYVVFMASGFIAFNMYRNIVSGSAGAFTANKGLFTYKQVKPIDTILARSLVSMFITSIIVCIFLFVGFLLEYEVVPKNILMVFFAYLWLLLFAFAFGLVVAIGNTFFSSVGKLVGIISLPLLIFSAVFYPLISLPVFAQKILLYNPLVHFMEMVHGYYMDGLDDRFVDYRYMTLWTIALLFTGTWLYSKLQERIISL